MNEKNITFIVALFVVATVVFGYILLSGNVNETISSDIGEMVYTEVEE